MAAVVFGHAPAAPAQRVAPAGDVSVVVYVIEASEGVPGVDPAIRHIVKDFHETLRYSTYKLLSRVSRKIPVGKDAKVSLPGERELRLYAQGYEAKRIKLKAIIIDKSNKKEPREILSTQFRISRGVTMLIGGYNYRDGKLILAISADR